MIARRQATRRLIVIRFRLLSQVDVFKSRLIRAVTGIQLTLG
jgi:hypothetical protein